MDKYLKEHITKVCTVSSYCTIAASVTTGLCTGNTENDTLAMTTNDTRHEMLSGVTHFLSVLMCAYLIALTGVTPQCIT